MDYFAGLDISMNETHVCVLDREGMVVRESKAESTAQAVANELAKAPSCRRIIFETGRMAPILFHGLSQLGLPVVCVESRQAYQALNDDAGLLAKLAALDFRVRLYGAQAALDDDAGHGRVPPMPLLYQFRERQRQYGTLLGALQAPNMWKEGER